MTITNVLKFETTDDVKLLDARGPRFGAVITTLVLAAILATGSLDRKSTRLNSSHVSESRMPSSA